MFVHVIAIASLLCLAAGCSSSPTAAPASTTATPLQPTAGTLRASAVIFDCGGNAVAAPGDMVLACGDAAAGVKALVWSNWGGPTASAKGTGYMDDCAPNCAQGHFDTY